MNGAPLELVGCPECAAPAEVVDRFTLDSTDGPVEHVRVRCVLRHQFTILGTETDRGVVAQSPGDSAARRRSRRPPRPKPGS